MPCEATGGFSVCTHYHSTPYTAYRIAHICAILKVHAPLYNGDTTSEGGGEVVDYSPLWDTMKEKGVTQYALIQAGIDRRTFDWLKKNKNITMMTLEKLCMILDCSPNDVVRFERETAKPQE